MPIRHRCQEDCLQKTFQPLGYPIHYAYEQSQVRKAQTFSGGVSPRAQQESRTPGVTPSDPAGGHGWGVGYAFLAWVWVWIGETGKEINLHWG